MAPQGEGHRLPCKKVGFISAFSSRNFIPTAFWGSNSEHEEINARRNWFHDVKIIYPNKVSVGHIINIGVHGSGESDLAMITKVQ